MCYMCCVKQCYCAVVGNMPIHVRVSSVSSARRQCVMGYRGSRSVGNRFNLIKSKGGMTDRAKIGFVCRLGAGLRAGLDVDFSKYFKKFVMLANKKKFLEFFHALAHFPEISHSHLYQTRPLTSHMNAYRRNLS